MDRRAFLALVPFVPAPLRAEAMSNKELREYLATMRAAQRGYMNAAPSEGEYFYRLVRRMRARHVLEIGTSNGYSTVWFAMALRETGGRLITLEIDKGRYDLAQANFKVTGLASVIDSRLADAKVEAGRVQGPFDVVFIDGWKRDSRTYFDAVLPKLRRGGVILAHFPANTPSPPGVTTEILALGPGALSVSTIM